MTTKLICASHSPLMLSTSPRDKGQADRFFGTLEELRHEIAEFDPEVVAIFAPDHFNGFFYNVMPSFCIGFDAVVGNADSQVSHLQPAKIAPAKSHMNSH